ncbi:MAG: hypothetical protein QM602_07905 [Microbacterium sp.]
MGPVMIGYQIGTAIRELFSLRFRALLLILQVVVVAATLSATLNDALGSVNDIGVARSLENRDVSYFTIFYDDTQPPEINEQMDSLLSDTLDGTSADYSIIKNNYFDGDQLAAPILVALGGFDLAYDLTIDTAEQDAVLIGANVTAYEIGDVLVLGDHEATVTGRLPAGMSYLDPWMGYESLDDHVVLLSTYDRFAAVTTPDVWQQEIVGRTVLFDAPDALIDGFVDTAASTGGIGLVPQHLDQRISNVYEAQLARSSMFLLFFSCLLLVLLGTIVSTVDALVAGNLRRYIIERLYGAHDGHVLARVNLFLAVAFSVPTLLIFGAFSTLTPDVATTVAYVIAAVIAAHIILSVRVVATLRRASVTSLLRKE